jgi:hypothetical protein
MPVLLPWHWQHPSKHPAFAGADFQITPFGKNLPKAVHTHKSAVSLRGEPRKDLMLAFSDERLNLMQAKFMNPLPVREHVAHGSIKHTPSLQRRFLPDH